MMSSRAPGRLENCNVMSCLVGLEQIDFGARDQLCNNLKFTCSVGDAILPERFTEVPHGHAAAVGLPARARPL